VSRFPWADVDRCSPPARKIAADYWRLATDLGGMDALSTQQLALVERAALLLVRIRRHESAVIAGQKSRTGLPTPDVCFTGSPASHHQVP
jgi:hypothetical protein